MKQLLLSLILLLALGVGGASAQEKLHRIHQFATLNTIAGDFAMQPNECRKAHDIDWGRNVGSITKRYGYDSVSYIAGQDSAIGLYGAYYSDGTQQLIFVTDSANQPLGNVYASPKGKAHFIGTVTQTATFNPKDSYPWVDSLTIDGDTTVVSFTSDADATCSEIAHGLADTINNHSTLSDLVTAYVDSIGGSYRIGYCKWWLKVTTIAEGTTFLMMGDTALSISQKSGTIYTQIWTDFAVLNKPSFAMYGDVVFGVNGSHKGIAYNGDVCRSWPLNAPGEPTIVPLKTNSGPLDGEFRYTFTYLRGLGAGDSSYTTAGIVTTPVRVRNGQILVKDFQWVGADMIDASPDSVGVVVYRTRANPGRLDQRDSAFLIDTIWGTSAANLATKTLIDSVADDDLANGISIWVDDYIGRDSAYAYDHRYGAPTFLSTDSVLLYTTATDTTCAYGIFHGIPEQVDTLGVLYKATFVDTVLGIESNAGPALSYSESDTVTGHAYSLRIGLPLPVNTDSGIVCNLYRAHIISVTYDTTMDSALHTFYIAGPRGDIEERQIWRPYKRAMPDSVSHTNFYLVAQVSLDSTAYTDDKRWDSITVGAGAMVFAQSTPPPFLTQIFAHEGRMFGIAGSRLWMSRLDSAGAWGAIDNVALGLGDGDEIITAFVSRGVIRVMKNHSNYNVYSGSWSERGVGDWVRQEVSGYWGCIAPYSHAAGPLGHYYLSDRGVIRESGGQFLERTQAIELISAPLRNFTNLPITTLMNTEGFYFDQKAMFSVGDTTYVYDERAKAWSTWGMTFSDATLYGTEDELNFLPGDSMYFIQSGSSNLYRYGTSELDNGAAFSTRWRSGPLLAFEPGNKTINKIELVTQTGEVWSTIRARLYDESDVQVTAIRPGATPDYLEFSELSDRYRMLSLLPHGRRYYSLDIQTSSITSASDIAVDLIDIYWTPGMMPVVE